MAGHFRDELGGILEAAFPTGWCWQHRADKAGSLDKKSLFVHSQSSHFLTLSIGSVSLVQVVGMWVLLVLPPPSTMAEHWKRFFLKTEINNCINNCM